MAFEHDYKEFPELTNQQLEQFQFSSPHIQITEDFEAIVVKVHDGDTITLRVKFRDFDFPLRLLDIDAPELNAGGDEAKEWLTRRILDKKVQIIINRHQRVGKYGRLLGKVFHGGLDVGKELLSFGLVLRFGDEQKRQLPSIEKMFDLKQWF